MKPFTSSDLPTNANLSTAIDTHVEAESPYQPSYADSLGKTARCEIVAADIPHFESLIQLWEASVMATHDFLAEEDRQFYQSFLPTAFTEIKVFFLPGPDDDPVGFIGIGGDKIEMLFIHPSWIGKGFGKRFLDFAVFQHNVCRVDVNEQNGHALAFYRKRGFEVVGRDAEDGYGKPYPILHLQLKT